MASLLMHLAVAKRYLEKNGLDINDQTSFYDANILPDFDDDKERSHYGKRGESKDLIKRHKEKVGLKKFLETRLCPYKLDTDMDRGLFLHLYTDWIYYNELLPLDYLATIDMTVFPKDNVYTSIVFDPYLEKTYGMNYGLTSMQEQVKEQFVKWNLFDEKRWGKDFSAKILFTKEQLDDFIELASELQIDEIVKLVQSGKIDVE